jgi:hypothetical protein
MLNPVSDQNRTTPGSAPIKIRLLILLAILVLSACQRVQRDQTGPAISDIAASGDVLVISDCQPTALEITAKVTDPSGVANVLLWVRVGSDQPYTSITMKAREGIYTASLKGVDLLGQSYGTMEFYITAEDGEGNSSRSSLDESIQFLPCVNN